jgi:hypothetical protein
MADVTLTYKGSTIAEMNASGSKTLKTAGKYCEGDIGVSYVKPSGGGSGVEIPDSAFVISGMCNNFDYKGKWDSFITAYADKWSTQNISSCSNMFNGTNLQSIPFDINLEAGTQLTATGMFGSTALTTLPVINGENIIIGYINALFSYSGKLSNIPDNYLSAESVLSYGNISTMFDNCSSLRNFPSFASKFATLFQYRHSASLYYYMCDYCYVLDEITNLGVSTLPTWTANAFCSTLDYCSRLKSFTFESGKSANWKNQTITLTEYVGYAQAAEQIQKKILDKRVSNAESYAALKNDADWWTTDIAYSRYNHDSAVATINSLPDTSAYLATAGGTNTIKFKGAAGSATDGGAINTLTEEEIAVATAKGWTCSLV